MGFGEMYSQNEFAISNMNHPRGLGAAQNRNCRARLNSTNIVIWASVKTSSGLHNRVSCLSRYKLRRIN